MIYGLKDTPSYLWWYSKIKIHIPYVFFSKIGKNTFFFCYFLAFFASFAPPGLFTDILASESQGSYKLCRSVLEVQRSNFRPPIIFPATSGQMASHILRSRKSQNLPKNRFWPKIQISIEWPILAEMMIYGRKWVPEVFLSCFAPKIDI